MFQGMITVLVFLSSFTDSGEIVPAFKDSILEGNVPAAVDMISDDAILMVDSVLSNDPEQISRVLLYFGLQIEISEMEEMNGKQLMTEILSSPAVSGAILLFGISAGEAVSLDDRTFVPVYYGLFGNRETIHLELVSDEGIWKIQDFFEILPE
ncbi:MAG: hypothetical protein KAR44_01990 [Candidatus Aegiribacteria sp.]|nr:hypothetical protein [Candidatus Aegiribacteria sp.]